MKLPTLLMTDSGLAIETKAVGARADVAVDTDGAFEIMLAPEAKRELLPMPQGLIVVETVFLISTVF
jgi:hypothetical protein